MTQWIPVTERLPENSDDVLVTCTFEDDEGAMISGITVASYHSKWEPSLCDWNKYWSDEQGNVIEVLAWIPLPEIYEEYPE